MAIEVQTTQNVIIDYEPANLGQRIAAYFIDLIFVGLWYFLWTILVFSYGDVPFIDAIVEKADVFIYIIAIFPPLFYDLFFEYFYYGQTPAKKLMRIRVIKTDGSTPTLGAYILRWLFRPIDFMMSNGMLAIILVACTKKSQRLGDYVANTTVIDLRINPKNKELTINDLDFADNYTVNFPDITDHLSDRDIQSILATLGGKKKSHEDTIVRMAYRLKQIGNYTYEGSDRQFLEKAVNDYHYLVVQ